MNKRLFLIFHGRFPSEKAASLFAAKSAEAFVDQGLKVTLLVPDRKAGIAKDPYEYYGVLKCFDIVYIKTGYTAGIFGLQKLTFVLSYVSFSLSLFFYLRKNSNKEDIIYSNEILPLAVISWVRKNTFYEMHDFPESKLGLFGWMLRRMKWILIHNKWKLNEFKNLFPFVPVKRIIYEPNAVDIEAFNIPVSKEQARAKLSLPQDKKIAVYTGHLYSWKGTGTLAEAAKLLPGNFLVVFVGGTSSDIEKFKDKYGYEKRILIAGHVTHSEIPMWQKAADVLVLPNTAKEKISAFYTSPMKLFEYMASSRPIVASNIPSIREILNEGNAILVQSDNIEDLASSIGRSVADLPEAKNYADKISKQAMMDVSSHTWVKRAERIINFIYKT